MNQNLKAKLARMAEKLLEAEDPDERYGFEEDYDDEYWADIYPIFHDE